MAVTCPHCNTSFPNSNTLNARHKAACVGWREQLGDTKPRTCLCGHESSSLTQMKRHRAQCEIWKTRHRGMIQMERFGVTETLAAPEIRTQIRATNIERYGGPSPSCSPDVVERARQTNLTRWGVEWTAQHPEVRQLQLETMKAHYGEHFFASDEGKSRLRAIFMAEYGVPHPMLVPEIAFKAISRAGNTRSMNTLERRFASLNPELHYVGNGGFW